MTTTESDPETRDCQQRENDSVLSRRSKAEKIKSKETPDPAHPHFPPLWPLMEAPALSYHRAFALDGRAFALGVSAAWNALPPPSAIPTAHSLSSFSSLSTLSPSQWVTASYWRLPPPLEHELLRTEINVRCLTASPPDFFHSKVISYNVIRQL